MNAAGALCRHALQRHPPASTTGVCQTELNRCPVFAIQSRVARRAGAGRPQSQSDCTRNPQMARVHGEPSMRCMVTTCGIKMHPVRETLRLARTGPGVFPEIDCVEYQQAFEHQAPRRRIPAQNVSILAELCFLEVHSVRFTSCWKFYSALSGTGKGGFVGRVLGKDNATTQQTNARTHQAQAHSRGTKLDCPL
ncbi:hypothetical protein MRX96_030908 [Rhipicephalus microplus]